MIEFFCHFDFAFHLFVFPVVVFLRYMFLISRAISFSIV